MNPEARIALFSKRNGLIGVSAMAVTFGLLLGNPALGALGGLLAGVLIAAGVLSHHLLDGFSVARRHSPRCLQGETLGVDLFLRNRGRRAALALEAEERFEPSTRSRALALILEPVGPGQEALFHYRRHCEKRRGLYVVGPTWLTAADPLGLFPRRIEMDSITKLLVVPRGAQLERFDILGRGTLFAVGAETGDRPGAGEEFLELREYRRGDSPRLIHWPSSARARRFFVKDFNVNVSTDAAIFLDMSRLAHTGIGDITSGEWAVNAAVSVAEAAIESQHRVGLFIVGRGVDALPFGGGHGHLNAILDRLTLARPLGDDDILAAARERLHLLRRGSTAVFIVTATRVQPDDLESILQHLADDAIKSVVVLIDNTTFPKIYAEQERQQLEAPPMEELARRFTLAGAQVYRLAREDDLREQLSRPDFASIAATD